MDQNSSPSTTERLEASDASPMLKTPLPISYDTPTTEELQCSLDLPTSQEIPLIFANKSLYPEAAKSSSSVSLDEKTPVQLADANPTICTDNEKSLMEELAAANDNGVPSSGLQEAEIPERIDSRLPADADKDAPNIVNLQNFGSVEEWVRMGEGKHVYIGRGSMWGNSHKLSDHENDRDQVLNLYYTDILKDDELMEKVGELEGKILGCWCAPERCHGEIIHKLAGNRPQYEGVSAGESENLSSKGPKNVSTLSPGTQLINVLSEAIENDEIFTENDKILDNSSISSTRSKVFPKEQSCFNGLFQRIVSTDDTMAAYSEIADPSALSPISETPISETHISSQSSPSQTLVVEDTNLVVKSRSGSDPLPHARTVGVVLNPLQNLLESSSILNDIAKTAQRIDSQKESISKSMPNLSVTSDDQEYVVDPQALSKVLWGINSKLEGFEKKFDNFHNKIDYLEVYLKSLISDQFANLGQRLDVSAGDCERSRKSNFDDLCGKIGDCVRENETIRTQWREHMDRMRENLKIMEEREILEVESDEEAEDDDHTDHRRPLENAGEGAEAEKVKELEKVIENLNEKIIKLDYRIVECEQYSRRENLVITGIPESVEDVSDLENVVVSTFKKLGINIRVEDISACHRLGPYRRNSYHPRSVIVRFVNRKLVYLGLNRRDKLWGLRGELKMHLRFYESLCSLNNESRKICNGLLQRGKITSFSIWHGFVKVVVNEGDRPLRIRHPDILKEMFDVSWFSASYR